MVDLDMPEGLSEEERRRWLLRKGQQLVEVTGQPSGVTEQQDGAHGQPVWGVWWSDEGDAEDQQ